jgi:hypothetical protein
MGNTNPKAGVEQPPVFLVKVLEIEHVHFGLAQVQSLAQVANEIEIFNEEIRLDDSNHGCEKSDVPVQKHSESALFVVFGRASKLFAEQGPERQVGHVGMLGLARKPSTEKHYGLPNFDP